MNPNQAPDSAGGLLGLKQMELFRVRYARGESLDDTTRALAGRSVEDHGGCGSAVKSKPVLGNSLVGLGRLVLAALVAHFCSVVWMHAERGRSTRMQ